MGRLVETRKRAGAVAAGGGEENALTRIAKYIPAEVLAFYAMWTQGAAVLPWSEYVLEVCIAGAVIGIIATYVYFDRFFPDAPERSRNAHRIISPLAFAVHGYTVTGAVVGSIFIPAIALLATALVTLLSAVYISQES